MRFPSQRPMADYVFRAPRQGLVNSGRTSHGFTLVELLVSIGIIALLVALGFGGSQKIRDAAEGAKCANNLRQIGIATQLYVNEHDQTLPGPIWGGQDPFYWKNDVNMLVYFLAPYMSCPDITFGKQLAPSMVCPTTARLNQNAWVRSYSVNLFATATDGTIFAPFGYPGGNPPPGFPCKIFTLKSIAKTWLVQDNDLTINGKVTITHGKTRNRLFWDGHVDKAAVNPSSPYL